MAATPASLPSVLLSMQNNCGYGNPMLVASDTGDVLAQNTALYFTSSSTKANAYLDNGSCQQGGANCSTVSFMFENATAFAQIAVTSPFAYTVPLGFSFVGGGCDLGYYCESDECLSAGPAEIACSPSEEAQLVIFFCQNIGNGTTSASQPSAATTHKSSKPTAAIAGGTIGGLALLVSLFLIFLIFRRKSRSRSRRNSAFRQRFEKYEFNNGFGVGGIQPGGARSAAERQPYVDLEQTETPAGWDMSGDASKADHLDSSKPFRELPTLEKAQLR